MQRPTSKSKAVPQGCRAPRCGQQSQRRCWQHDTSAGAQHLKGAKGTMRSTVMTDACCTRLPLSITPCSTATPSLETTFSAQQCTVELQHCLHCKPCQWRLHTSSCSTGS